MSTQQLTQTNASVMDANLMTGLRSYLKGWSPSTKAQAVRMLAFLSATNNEAVTKRIKSECYNFLLGRCANCENAVDAETGIEVTRVEKTTKYYNTNETIDDIENQMNELKKRLDDEREKAGVSHFVTTVYYKVKP